MAFLVVMLIATAWQEWRTWRARVRWRWRWRLVSLKWVPRAALALGGTVATAWVLWQISPALRWSWWSALGGQGAPITGGVSTSTAGSSSLMMVALAIAVLMAVALLLPTLAHREERHFRRGIERMTRFRQFGSALLFGLMHALVGLPLAVALALSVLGVACNRAYLNAYAHTGSRHAAVTAATGLHVTYNMMILVPLVSIWAPMVVVLGWR